MGALDGYKTYITAGLVALVTGLQYANVISADQADNLYKLLAAFGLYAVKSAIVKSGPPTP